MADDRLVEIMADMLDELRGLKKVTEGMASDITELKVQQGKTNVALGEMRLSNMKLAERIEEIVNLDQRVRTLENIVLPKAS
ncbi:hypothetical protein [Hymenobacter aerophilus]|uniref:hypothetical protein n=1 Tax=Hymenobacter aerophilus TaxID=119644 RepID=UPI000362AF4C|nr:hypothetical protein [Hymenobacter aerophilus]